MHDELYINTDILNFGGGNPQNQYPLVNNVDASFAGNSLNSTINDYLENPNPVIINKYDSVTTPFFGNLNENNFFIFISAFAFLLSTNISIYLIKFLLIAIIAILIDNNYGVSIAIILYSICSLEKIKGIVMSLLIIAALMHIFIPYNMTNSSFNWNYIIQIILALVMLYEAYRTDKERIDNLFERKTLSKTDIIIEHTTQMNPSAPSIDNFNNDQQSTVHQNTNKTNSNVYSSEKIKDFFFQAK
jgi:hypothetical protein